MCRDIVLEVRDVVEFIKKLQYEQEAQENLLRQQEEVQRKEQEQLELLKKEEDENP